MAKEIEVIGDKISSKEISSEISIDLSGIPKANQSDVKDQIGNFLIEQILATVGSQNSPIRGKDWPKLNKEYAKSKKEDGFSPVANLERTGEMLGSLEFKITKDGVKIGIFDNKDEVAKADGHNNFSNESLIPTRQFLPKTGESFEKDIENQIKKIIIDASAEASSASKSDFKDVSTKNDLYDVLKGLIGEYSRTELKLAALRSEEFLAILEDLDLLDLL